MIEGFIIGILTIVFLVVPGLVLYGLIFGKMPETRRERQAREEAARRRGVPPPQ